ncbi:UNKNOWN [Stylonychia lemnae]|uniref:Uncharacterized protein n=1 Tax=Stylonychia lemnae TaxID=5949 RepID=A0A078A6P6_STYLE|nr:UNKNOWN [Stylonychia lemnae]|eukprot:CDW76409.1 UNKNOWN [Stylonychia lemnae]
MKKSLPVKDQTELSSTGKLRQLDIRNISKTKLKISKLKKKITQPMQMNSIYQDKSANSKYQYDNEKESHYEEDQLNHRHQVDEEKEEEIVYKTGRKSPLPPTGGSMERIRDSEYSRGSKTSQQDKRIAEQPIKSSSIQEKSLKKKKKSKKKEFDEQIVGDENVPNTLSNMAQMQDIFLKKLKKLKVKNKELQEAQLNNQSPPKTTNHSRMDLDTRNEPQQIGQRNNNRSFGPKNQNQQQNFHPLNSLNQIHAVDQIAALTNQIMMLQDKVIYLQESTDNFKKSNFMVTNQTDSPLAGGLIQRNQYYTPQNINDRLLQKEYLRSLQLQGGDLFAERMSKINFREYANNTRLNINNISYANQKDKRDRAMKYWKSRVISNFLPPIDFKKREEINERVLKLKNQIAPRPSNMRNLDRIASNMVSSQNVGEFKLSKDENSPTDHLNNSSRGRSQTKQSHLNNLASQSQSSNKFKFLNLNQLDHVVVDKQFKSNLEL